MAERIPPSPLNRQPLGLLDFFGIKNNGHYPEQLLSNLQPVLDLFRHYTEVAAEIFTFSATFVANATASSVAITSTNPTQLSNGVNVIVPANEVWYVAAAHVQWTLPQDAAARAWFNLADTDPVGAVPGYSRYWPALLQGYTEGSAVVIRRGLSVVTTPVYILPGRLMIASHNGLQVPAGQTDMYGSVSLVRMKL